eukprot:8702943-Alexandrium_andersonii.AAC.1
MVSHGKSGQAKIWWYAYHRDGQAASLSARSTSPQYYLVHPHVTARLPPLGQVPPLTRRPAARR